jgi:membrane protein
MGANEQGQPEEKKDGLHPLERVASAVRNLEEVEGVKKRVGPLRAFWAKFSNDWTMNLQAAALAYNLVVAIFPILLALFLIFGLVLGSMGAKVQQTLIATVATVIPQGLGQGIVQQVLANIQQAAGILGLITLATALFGGSRLFILMENCFDLIYHRPPRSVLRQNLMAFGMLLVFVVLIPVMILASSVPALLISWLKTTFLSGIPAGQFIFSAVGITSSLLFSWILFEAIYIVVPNQRISFRESWRGAVIAAIGLQIYLTLFPFYATNFLKGYGGQAGFAVIMIAFFYYFAVILLLGAQVNAFIAERVQKTPMDLATLVHKETSLDVKPAEEQHVQATRPHKHDMDEREE